MDYSLQTLNKNLKLKDLTLSTFVEKLNLIGLEVDDISSEKLSTNVFLEDINILLKIPANREDLLNEKFFLKEISTIFLLDIYQIWEKLKDSYSSLLQRKYLDSVNYSTIFLPSSTTHVIKYIIGIENVEIKPSPTWIVKKLAVFNLQPVNNLTDILNLVFSEWGQTINILLSSQTDFQIDCLLKEEIYTDSTSQKVSLYPGTVVLRELISNNILSVLGIVNSTFQNINDKRSSSFFLEATFYDIHNNPLFLNSFDTKISLKHLRRACLQNFKLTFQRILTLVEILTYGKIIPIKYCTKIRSKKLESTKILSLQKKNLVNFLNVTVPDPIIFKRAGLDIICETETDYYFKIPTYRHDLSREIDLIEEYSRFIGYKNFKEILPQKDLRYTKSLFRQKYFSKNYFLHNGFYEIFTNPIADFENRNTSSMFINNPLNSELSTLRRSLLPKILEVFELNSRSAYGRTNFFEFGRTFKKVQNKIVEQDKLGGIFQLNRPNSIKSGFSDWFIAKGLIENFLKNFGYFDIQYKQISSKNCLFHSTRSVLFYSEQKMLGVFGELNPILRKEQYSHIREPIYLFELNNNYLQEWKLTSPVKIIQEYSKYPSIVKDLSILVTRKINIQKLKEFILLQSTLLQKITLFDIYFDEKFGEKVNLGIRFEFQSKNETLTNEVVEREVENLKNLIEAEILFISSSII
jgi:phenylalanyl-tRNA synthetase beta chain